MQIEIADKGNAAVKIAFCACILFMCGEMLPSNQKIMLDDDAFEPAYFNASLHWRSVRGGYQVCIEEANQGHIRGGNCFYSSHCRSRSSLKPEKILVHTNSLGKVISIANESGDKICDAKVFRQRKHLTYLFGFLSILAIILTDHLKLKK